MSYLSVWLVSIWRHRQVFIKLEGLGKLSSKPAWPNLKFSFYCFLKNWTLILKSYLWQRKFNLDHIELFILIPSKCHFILTFLCPKCQTFYFHMLFCFCEWQKNFSILLYFPLQEFLTFGFLSQRSICKWKVKMLILAILFNIIN